MRIIGGAAAVLALVALVGCSAKADTSPQGQFLAHVQNVPDDQAVRYGSAACATLAKANPAGQVDVAMFDLALVSSAKLTPEDAKALTNAAVTYLCPQYASLAQA